MGIVTGPIRRGDGTTPAVALVDPKFPHNVGAAVRAAICATSALRTIGGTAP